ncbi:MAG: hypothetical protein ACKVHO_05680 [Verrucomicrobiia bacterium]
MREIRGGQPKKKQPDGPKKRQEAIRQLDDGRMVCRHCGDRGRPTRITYIDIGWDIFSTREHSSFDRPEQNAIKSQRQ